MGYSRTAVFLHWALAAAILASLAVGLTMTSLPFSPARLKLYNWHKWAGILILTASAVRLLWRLTHRPPEDPPMPLWQLRAAHVAHLLMYVLFFAVPIVGWAYSSAAGFPVVLFGVIALPDFVPKDTALAELLKPWHAQLAWLLGIVIAAHVLAALKHHFIDRDGLLRRMAWGVAK